MSSICRCRRRKRDRCLGIICLSLKIICCIRRGLVIQLRCRLFGVFALLLRRRSIWRGELLCVLVMEEVKGVDRARAVFTASWKSGLKSWRRELRLQWVSVGSIVEGQACHFSLILTYDLDRHISNLASPAPKGLPTLARPCHPRTALYECTLRLISHWNTSSTQCIRLERQPHGQGARPSRK